MDKFGTKFFRESGLKLPKTLKDMLVKLMEKVERDPKRYARMQTIGIIHARLVMMPIYMDLQDGFVYRVQRGRVIAVLDSDEIIPAFLEMIATVLGIKAAMQETAKTVNEKTPVAMEMFKKMGANRGVWTKKQELPACMMTPTKK